MCLWLWGLREFFEEVFAIVVDFECVELLKVIVRLIKKCLRLILIKSEVEQKSFILILSGCMITKK